jgi:hypothetical protein
VHDTVHNVETYIARALSDLKHTNTSDLVKNRYRKWRSLGRQAAVTGTRAAVVASRITSTGRTPAAKQDSPVAKV